MSVVKISALTELTTLGDNDLVVVVDYTTDPLVPVTKKMKASVLRTQLLKSVKYANVISLTANTPTIITFTNSIGSNVSGQDYALFINNTVAETSTGFTVTGRTQNGFTIESMDNTIAEIICMLKN